MSKYKLDDLLTLMSRLRDPDGGCPWDLEQNFQSIVSSTLEEAYEVVDAIEKSDYLQLKEELGDLLFQIVFYSQLGREQGYFNFAEIVSGLTEKLVRRHPHVFPDGTLESRADPAEAENEALQRKIRLAWEQIKQEEREAKGYQGVLDDIPNSFPAVTRAYKLQKRAARVGFDWHNTDGVYEKVQEEIIEVQQASEQKKQDDIKEEIGDLLFSVINLSRHLNVEPETALRQANDKFERRFRYLEKIAKEAGYFSENNDSSVPLDTLEEWWLKAKQNT